MVAPPTLLLASVRHMLIELTMVSVWPFEEPVRGRLETILIVPLSSPPPLAATGLAAAAIAGVGTAAAVVGAAADVGAAAGALVEAAAAGAVVAAAAGACGDCCAQAVASSATDASAVARTDGLLPYAMYSALL